MDLKKTFGRVPREELWHCIIESGVAKKYVSLVLDSRTVVRCGVGVTDWCGWNYIRDQF